MSDVWESDKRDYLALLFKMYGVQDYDWEISSFKNCLMQV